MYDDWVLVKDKDFTENMLKSSQNGEEVNQSSARDTNSLSLQNGYASNQSLYNLIDVGDRGQEITKRHWVPSEARLLCTNKHCRFKFTLFKRQHHCRMCGEVFCNDCVAFRLRLNFLATVDPEGRLYKVCESCYLKNRDDTVHFRSCTEDFLNKRRQRKTPKTSSLQDKSLFKSWRDMLNIEKECERLREGFKNCSLSEVKRTLHSVEKIIKTPEWQKSSVWMMTSLSDKCRECLSGFGPFRGKSFCKVCGVFLCKSCIHKELLVYIPDDVNDNVTTDVELAIIKIVGCPEVEPDISVLLDVCTQCRQYLVDQQTRVSTQTRSEVKDVDEGVMVTLIGIDKTMFSLQTKITFLLDRFKLVIESLDDNSRASSERNNTKILAKSQGDLSDHFASFSTKIPVLKDLKKRCTSKTQTNLLSNFTKAKSDFYLETVFRFRKLKEKLADSAPVEILEHIQKIVDKNAIVCTQICIRQLIFECIGLSLKYKLQEDTSGVLKQLDEVVEGDVVTCLRGQGDDLDEHKHYLATIIKKEMKDRPLIRLSRRQLSEEGPKHAADVIVQRLPVVLEKVKVQLTLKSMERSFKSSKSCLNEMLEHVKTLTSDDLLLK